MERGLLSLLVCAASLQHTKIIQEANHENDYVERIEVTDAKQT